MSNKETTLAEATSSIEALTAEKTQLEASLAEANAKADSFEVALNSEKTAHAATKTELDAEKSRQRDLDKEVALAAAAAAVQSGAAEPVETKASAELTDDEIIAKVGSLQGVELGAFMAKHGTRISALIKEGK